MSAVRTYLVTARVQKRMDQPIIDAEMKVAAESINGAMERFKANAVQSKWHRAWIIGVTMIEDALVN